MRILASKLTLAELTVVFTAFYFFWNPSEISFLPICPFKYLTGFYCPGCGGQRAFHNLLHGNFLEAFHSNLLIYLFLPFCLLKISDEILGTTFSDNFLLANRGIWIFLCFLAIFTFLRNVPSFPFNQLIPLK